MRGVILAAGCGSRMGDQTDAVPKAFIEIDGETLYERQREVLDRHVDGVTVVLGYEYENALDRLSSADAVVLKDWDEYDNAESLRRALARIEDDVVVLNGDVVVGPSVLDRLARRFDELGGAYNVVGCLPGTQSEHTAIRADESGDVVAYGEISGHRHAGVGILSAFHRERALSVLERNAEGWYPNVYPETPTKRVVVPPERHIEINRPGHLETARERLPLVRNTDPKPTSE